MGEYFVDYAATYVSTTPDGGEPTPPSWTLLTEDDVLETHDPNSMISAELSVDEDGWWEIGLTQPELGTRHQGQGCVVIDFALPQLGENALREDFAFWLEFERPSSGGWGIGIGIGDYDNSDVHAVQGQFVIGTTPDEWRIAVVRWAALTTELPNVPDSATAELRGHASYTKGTTKSIHLYGVLISGASGVVDAAHSELADTVTAPVGQIVISSSETGAQAGTIRFRPHIFSPSESET